MNAEVESKSSETTSASNSVESISDEGNQDEKKEQESEVQKDTNIKVQGLKAGPTTPSKRHTSDEIETTNQKKKLPESQPYDKAPYIPYDKFSIQDGDFIRYVKEDNIVYQGEILRGQPVEHNFNYYDGQDDDYVVKLNFNKGKHVAATEFQQEDKIHLMTAKQQTSFGRNIETVSPDEIIAVSPNHEYDWYKFEEKWDKKNDKYVID